MSAARAYDAIATRYDDLASANPVLAHMRAQSLAALARELAGSRRALEMGCGTGEEAVALLQRFPGLEVDALDPAPAMLDAARKRARAAGVEARLRLHLLAARDARKLEGPFDAAWSSFALAYEPDLARVAGALAALLEPGAPFVVTLRNPWCLAEPWSIPARVRGTYRHKVGQAREPVQHWSLPAARRVFAEAGFALSSARALPIALPPPRYGKLVPQRLAPALRRLDRAVAGWPVARAMGDHTMLVLRC